MFFSAALRLWVQAAGLRSPLVRHTTKKTPPFPDVERTRRAADRGGAGSCSLSQLQRQCRPCSSLPPPDHHLLTGHPQTLRPLLDASGESFFSFSCQAVRKETLFFFFFLGPLSLVLNFLTGAESFSERPGNFSVSTNWPPLGLWVCSLQQARGGFPLCAGGVGEREEGSRLAWCNWTQFN